MDYSPLYKLSLDCENITTVEQTCQKLSQGESYDLRAEAKDILRRAMPKPNISREERKALKELRETDLG